ncbi:MAG: uracil-DNA glycosylase family protein [Spirochaetaceae bacterium]|jgi:hypothetical protein|nr:uracil-DNA glycosylase family protein [Spirochaetaceae bacterium]
MDNITYEKFLALCRRFKKLTAETEKKLPALQSILQELVDKKSEKNYTVLRPVVYNTALDEITQNDKIKLILVGDNPGKKEQETGRYLVGNSGKIAENFFKKESCLNIDFRKNVIILNKTPVHTPRTLDIKKIPAYTAENDIASEIANTQRKMAELLFDFWQTLNVPVWITGYSEMRKNGIFEVYTDTLKGILKKNTGFKENVFVYRHFSMNQFTIDLNKNLKPNETIAETLLKIGIKYRERIFD